MAIILEDLIKLRTKTPESNITDAKLIYARNSIHYIEANQKIDRLELICRSQTSKNEIYKQTFSYVNNNLMPTCTCLHFESGAICKHIKACTFFLEKNDEALEKLIDIKENHNLIENVKVIKKVETSKELQLKDLPIQEVISSRITNYDDFDILNYPEKYFISTNQKENEAEIIFKSYQYEYKLKLKKLSDVNAKISCNCAAKKPCIHQNSALNYIRKNNFVFLNIIEKIELYKNNAFQQGNIPEKLKSFYTLNFSIDGKVSFIAKDENSTNLLQLLNQKNILEKLTKKTIPETNTQTNSNANDYIFYQLIISEDLYYLKPYLGKLKKNGEMAKRIHEIGEIIDFSAVNDSDEHIFMAKDIYKRLKKDNLVYNNYHLGDGNFDNESHDTVNQYWKKIALQNHVYFDSENNFYNQNFNKILLYPDYLTVEIEVFEEKNKIKINPVFYITVNELKQKINFNPENNLVADLFELKGCFYRTSPESTVLLTGLQEESKNYFGISIEKELFESIKKPLYANLLDKHHIEFKTKNLAPQIHTLLLSGKKIYLKEEKENFVIVPAFLYEHNGQVFESEMDNSKIVSIENDESNVLIERDIESENIIEDGLRALHPDFENQKDYTFFYLPHESLLDNNWFFTAFDYLKNEGFEILGLKDLKKLKYSPHKASINVSAGSGIDWFDIKVDMSFGAEKVGLAELKKALLNNQKYVTLSNGTLGMLPEEWIAKYERIIKGGKLKKDGIEFNQIQYGLIDHLYDEIGNNQSLLLFHEKRQKLLSFDKIDAKKIPSNVNATLRDYQIGGYQWLHFLDEFGWGGCLADDMGLGKTLQMLAFIQSKVNENKNIKILVVVPASLIFNWQREAENFCPDLKLLNQTGIDRDKEKEVFKKYNVILTTYALLRIDIETLKDVEFDYVILDESQAIKNPMSQTAKAAKILNSKNRLIMTGTPIENNTFDLYSQFDFLNPGLLGSIESFRENYATPIDRDRNEQAAESLRRLIYPFILSRKKDQVAKDLPPKIETVIYCEMSKNQRKVYNKVKDKIKDDLENLIAKDGINKSNFAILQGLLKLRQVCNSPALLSDTENTVHDSIKLDTLMESVLPVIAENHKVLIFSFFVEMLELIKERFKKEHIQYAWITGQTSKREEQVQQFQQDEHCKVFLISLKAGGVGLNLTAADYVYLIDPWWNPAVEQQAIDRAHRIGQKQSVFAYKLICKDTIEEKILQLQEKKKEVAADLVNIESGTIKKLSKDDVMDLFN